MSDIPLRATLVDVHGSVPMPYVLQLVVKWLSQDARYLDPRLKGVCIILNVELYHQLEDPDSICGLPVYSHSLLTHGFLCVGSAYAMMQQPAVLQSMVWRGLGGGIKHARIAPESG